MRKKIKNVILSIAIFLFSALLFAGCGRALTFEEILTKHNLTSSITYYANGGDFGQDIKEKTLRYKEGDIPLNIGVQSASPTAAASIKRADHQFIAWYIVEENADGTLKTETDDKGNVTYVLSDTQMDFTSPIEANKTYYVAAKWLRNETVDVYLKCEAGESFAFEEGKDPYQNGDLIWQYSYGSEETFRCPNAGPFVNVRQFAFLAFYNEDGSLFESCSRSDNGNENTKIYAHYIPGSWTVLKTAKHVESMFSAEISTANYYLFQDIDCSGITVERLTYFFGTFQGNGHTISNLTVRYTLTNKDGTNSVAAFGMIASGAKMLDVTFKNMKVQFTLNGNIGLPSMFFFASQIDAGATLSNVKIDGGELTVALSGGAVVNNFQNGKSDWWIVGNGKSDEDTTDEAILATLTTAKLAILATPTLNK